MEVGNAISRSGVSGTGATVARFTVGVKIGPVVTVGINSGVSVGMVGAVGVIRATGGSMVGVGCNSSNMVTVGSITGITP
jgi:hypothetical protein